MALDLTSFDAALKVHYGPQRMREIAFMRRPFLAMVPKYENFGGRNMPLPLKFAANPNRSRDFVSSQRSGTGLLGQSGSTQQIEYLITRVQNYAHAFIDGQTLYAAEGDVNAFVTAVTHEIDGTIEAITDDLHHDLFGSGSGAISTQVTATATAGLYNAPKEDLTRLFPGMVLVGAASENAALLTSGEERVVVAVDRSNGSFTVSDAVGGSGTDWTVDPAAIFAAGDRAAGAITPATYLKVTGLQGWLPQTAPGGGDSFFGVDRSADPEKLAGVRTDGSSGTISEGIIECVIDIARVGGRPDAVFMNHTDLKNLINELGPKVEYQRRGPAGMGSVGFTALQVATPVGVVDVYGDHACPVGTAFVLTMNTWVLASIGGAPRILSADGQRMLRVTNADQYEVRAGFYAQLGCYAPGHNGVLTLPSAGA
jgi:hypothetical protein